MLESIYIENFAIIDRLEVNFQNQMTVLTGETGAGKSIIIDAIGQLLGNRTQSSFIKTGCDEAFVEGVFVIEKNSMVFKKLKEFRIDYDDKLVVSKSFNRDNKTVIKINYRNVSKMVLQSIMADLLDIHSQFETHQLFDLNNHIIILDNFIGKEISILKQQYSKIYHEYRQIDKTYQTVLLEELSDEQLEYYQAQLAEINSLDLEQIDEEELEKEKKEMLDYEKINERISNYRQCMGGNQGVLASLNNALNELETLNDYEDYHQIYEKMYDLYYNLIDLDDTVVSAFNQGSYDEYRLNEVQDILFGLKRLKRKYGQSINAILEAKKELEEKINAFNNRDEYILDLQNQLDRSFIKAQELAKQITNLRKEYALKFEKKVSQELKLLYLDKVKFEVSFVEKKLHDDGQDEVVFLIATNVGQSLKPLNKVASGGEMSRIMLAIKSLSLLSSSIETIIFDEADTGVSGKVAESIGKKMKQLAKTHQVLCITHLAQVAAFADNHYLIKKTTQDNNTNVILKELNEAESINEIAKLISGKDVSVESIEHAKKLKQNSV